MPNVSGKLCFQKQLMVPVLFIVLIPRGLTAQKKRKEKRLLSASNLQVSQVQASQLQYRAKYFQDSSLTLPRRRHG